MLVRQKAALAEKTLGWCQRVLLCWDMLPGLDPGGTSIMPIYRAHPINEGGQSRGAAWSFERLDDEGAHHLGRTLHENGSEVEIYRDKYKIYPLPQVVPALC